LSAFGVASFHTHDWFPRSFGVVGFIVLLLSFCVFVVNRPEPYGFADLAKRKAARLLKPWLFWSLVYGGVGLVKMIYMDVPFSEVFSATMLLTGTRIHLWFLPFGFVAALLLVLVHQRTTKTPEIFNIVGAALVGLLCMFGCAIVQSGIQLPVPLLQWTLGLPTIPLGFAIGRTAVLSEPKDKRNLYLFTALATAAAFVAYTALIGIQRRTWFDHGSKFIIRHYISTVLVCAALHWRGLLGPISRTLGSLSYGIYLVHPLVLIFIYQFRILVDHPLALLSLVLVASAAITLVLERTPLRQFV
jgi:peptidoglycan/LPS O-acetylase OafA/YrhL